MRLGTIARTYAAETLGWTNVEIVAREDRGWEGLVLIAGDNGDGPSRLCLHIQHGEVVDECDESDFHRNANP